MTKKRFRENVKLAVELFGIEEVAGELNVQPAAIKSFMSGKVMPESAFILNKLNFMLKETA